jgi:hypothetical protein
MDLVDDVDIKIVSVNSSKSHIANLVNEFVKKDPDYAHHIRIAGTTNEMLEDVTTFLLLNPSNREFLAHFTSGNL